jgi:hypothetical protein
MLQVDACVLCFCLVSRQRHMISTIHQLQLTALEMRACAIYAHGSSHRQFTENPNILTLIFGFGRGNRFSIASNFSLLKQFFFPLRFSHLNSSFSTYYPNLLIPRRLSDTPQ